MLQKLNARHGYGVNLILLAIDEGIHGYRDDSLAALSRFAEFTGLPLRVVSFKVPFFFLSQPPILLTPTHKWPIESEVPKRTENESSYRMPMNL